MIALTDRQKIGVSLTLFGSLFFVMGIFLFLDAALMAVGNLLFLVGLPLILGPQKTLKFFTRPNKRVASVCFILGILMVFTKWVFSGLLFEGFGVLSLFGDFLPVVLSVLRNLPIVGNILNMPVISHFLDRVSRRAV